MPGPGRSPKKHDFSRRQILVRLDRKELQRVYQSPQRACQLLENFEEAILFEKLPGDGCRYEERLPQRR